MDELKQLYDRDSEIYDAIEQAFQSLAREGLIVDSGHRRWSERTRSYQIVWVAREFADPDQLRRNMN